MANIVTSSPRSWWTKFNNFWQSGKFDQAREKLIDRLTAGFEKGQEITRLGVGGLPFSRPAAQRPQLSWSPVMPQGHTNSGQASVVPSPQMDNYSRLWQLGQSRDLQERRVIYNEFDQIFNTSSVAGTAAKGLVKGAFKKNRVIKVVPEKGFENDSEAQDMAATSDEFWQRTYKLATLEWQRLAGTSVLRYGNAPIELVANDNAIIEELRQFAPYAAQINSDIFLKFRKGQRDAYAQFDDVGRNIIAVFPEALIIWLMTKDLAWHRYGTGRLYAALADARALIRAEATLPDSREAGQLEKWERFMDLAGGSVDQAVIDEARLNSREARKARGEAISPFDTRYYNGPSEVGMHAPPTGFFNELGDVRWSAGGVTAALGTHLAAERIPEQMNRATLDRIEEKKKEAAGDFGDEVCEMIFPPIFDRQFSWMNGLMAQQTSFYRLSTVQGGLLRHKVRLDIQSIEDELPERLLAKAERAEAAHKSGLIDWETAVESEARAQGKDPEVVKKNLIAEGRAPQYILDREAQKEAAKANNKPLLRAVQ